MSSKWPTVRLTGHRVVRTISFDIDRVGTHGRSAHHTLFRGNTMLTKTIESLMAWYGKAFLEASVGATIRRLCLENVSIEVDPLRNPKGPKDVERNVDLLVYWCREIWEQIYSVRHQCPKYVSLISRCMLPYSGPVRCANCSSIFASWWRGGIPQRSMTQTQIADCHGKASQRSVFFGLLCQLSSIHISLASALVCFAALEVHQFDNKPSGLPDLPVQRSLTLIAKVIQSLANLNAVCSIWPFLSIMPIGLVQVIRKEEFMRGVKSFLEEKIPEMLDYILVVSTPSPEEASHPPSEVHPRSRAIRVLQERKQAMPDLQKDAIPHEQHFLDIPRHLAIITSTVVRHSRNITPEDPAVADLFKRCRDVERHALYNVSRHATPRGGGASAAPSHASESAGGRSTAISNHSSFEAPQLLSPHRPKASSRSRPKTAPSAAMSDPALHTRLGHRLSQELLLRSEAELGGSSEMGREIAEEDDSWAALRRQASRPRSVSTDSVPDFRRTVPGSGGIRSVVEATRPERKKGFLRTILNRK
jgi:hypothetical protein